MSETFTLVLQIAIEGVAFQTQTSDLIDDSLTWKRGIFGHGPKRLVAEVGQLKFDLNNSETNSGSKVGYYTPGHADVFEDGLHRKFDIGARVRISYTYGGTTYYKFHGRLRDVNPDAGLYGMRRSKLLVADYMEILNKYKLEQLEVQANKRPDEVLTTVVAALPIAPQTADYDTDPDTYTRCLHTERDESSTGRSVIQKLAQSSMGRVFVVGNTTNGETLRWQSRHERLASKSLALTLSTDMKDLTVERSSKNIYNNVKVTTYPVEINAGATLYTSQREIEISPGQDFDFIANFTNALANGARLSGSENHVTPAENTHYRASSIEGGSGNDMSSDCSVTMGWGSNSADVSITNNGSERMYVNLFFLVGDALLLNDPVIYQKENTSSQALHGDLTLGYNMPYQENPNVGVDFGDFFEDRYSTPVTEINSVEFIANKNATLMTAAMTLDLGSRVKIIETVTALSDEFFVYGIEHTIKNKNLHVKLSLERASDEVFWWLGDAGYSELGDTTWLGF